MQKQTISQRQALNSILEQPSQIKVKIAQLQSLKLTFKQLLKQKHQHGIIQSSQLTKQAKQKNKTKTSQQEQEGRQSFLMIPKYVVRWSQEKEVKYFVTMLSRLFDFRKNLNNTHYQLQKINQTLGQKMKKYMREYHFDKISKLIASKRMVNSKARELLLEYKNLSFSMSVCCQTFNNLNKVYKVQYLVLKQKIKKRSKKLQQKRCTKRQYGQFQLADQNSNQILVNL